ncbi:hypothetical protein IKZ77_01295, partial [Candidatus Saccharibacteria bacterium]|nr:hypothetical protein [Candidatus Saccharibacteria bacterium]
MADDQKKASANLKAAEKSASADIAEQSEDSIDGALEEEEQARGFYFGGGKGLIGKFGKKEEKGVTLKKILKRRGPLGIILGMLLGVGGMMMGFQTMLPVAIEEMLIEKLNSVGTSSVIASDYWLDTQLNIGVREGQLHQGEYKSEEIFALSEWQVQSLEKQGFEVYAIDYLGKKWTVLLGKDEAYDIWIPAVGSDLLNDEHYNADEFLELIKADCGKDNVTAAVNAAQALANDRFRVAY